MILDFDAWLRRNRDRDPGCCGRWFRDWGHSRLRLDAWRHVAFDGGDPKFLRDVGWSVISLERFSSGLITEIGRREDQTDGLMRFVEFHSSLVSARVKDFLFREQPNAADNLLSFSPDVDACRAGERILECVGRERLPQNFPALVAEFYFNAVFLYEFLYVAPLRRGRFLRFSPDERQFDAILKIITREVIELDDGVTEMELCKRLRGLRVRILEEHCGLPSGDMRSLEKRYEAVLGQMGRVDVSLEPFTWRIGCLLWKFTNLLEDAEELPKAGDAKRLCSQLKALKCFVQAELDFASGAYDKGSLDFARMFNAEMRWMRELYGDEARASTGGPLFWMRSCEHVGKRMDALQRIRGGAVREASGESISPIPLKEVADTLSNGVRDGALKIETMIEGLSGSALESLFRHYAAQVSDDVEVGDCLVGNYASGGFLAHMVNLYGRNPDEWLPVWLFKSFPYVATHPIHASTGGGDRRRMLICDETIKTGFTLGLYEAWLARSGHIGDGVRAHPLIVVDGYERIPDLSSEVAAPVLRIRRGESGVQLWQTSVVDPQRGVSWPDALSRNDLDELSQSPSITEKGYADWTYLLTDTRLVCAVARMFAEEIVRRVGERKATTGRRPDVALYSPSGHGRILKLMLALRLKLDGETVILDKTEWRRRHRWCDGGTLFVPVDMTLNTGTTLRYRMADFIGEPDLSEKDFGRLQQDALVLYRRQ